jgi:uncharacterized protein (DUF1778 family)
MLFSVKMRASLLINCSRKEAELVRKGAGLQRRTVSGYVINIVIRAVEFSNRLVSSLGRSRAFKLPQGKVAKGPAPRTTLHIYCATDEAKRIRAAAFQRRMTISRFVLNCLHRSWETENAMELLSTRAASGKSV